jgi:hypothetical protein
MEGISHLPAINKAGKTLSVLCTVSGLVLFGPDALADHHYRDVTSSAQSNEAGVDFSIREVNEQSGEGVTTSSGVTCDFQLQFGNIGETSGYWDRSPTKTSVIAHRACSDGTDDFVWVDSCDYITSELCPSAAPTIDPVVLARRVRDSLPVPGLTISSNPGRGLVGLKSWFWLEGGGQPLSDSLSAFGVRVDVQALPVSYQWEFGDGMTMTTSSPGNPYPQPSPVKHTYQRSSAAHPAGYPVSVTTVFEVRWRTNRGRWRTLPGITRTAERSYPVAESQAVNSDG